MMKMVMYAAVFIALTGCGESAVQQAADSEAIPEIESQRQAREQILRHLGDPSSAEFRNQKGRCGEVNAQTSPMDREGFKRFIAEGKDMVFLEGDVRFDPGAFDVAWGEFCK